MLKALREERRTVAGLAALSEDLDDAQVDVHCCGDVPLIQNSTPLNHEATFYEYVIVNGRRYHASRTVGSNSSSLVRVTIPGAVPVTAFGELLEIFQFECRSGHSVWFGRIRWFKPWCGTRNKVWNDFASVDICLWELGEYTNQDTQLPALIDLDWITG
ncbi:hypothetical protein EDB19DRAFT_1835661 [Suillus lakei]|nr:hypothetical protein EDB19DRAFT_1835661 [Suillus lakei]